jgi:hypothetical protein
LKKSAVSDGRTERPGDPETRPGQDCKGEPRRRDEVVHDCSGLTAFRTYLLMIRQDIDILVRGGPVGPFTRRGGTRTMIRKTPENLIRAPAPCLGTAQDQDFILVSSYLRERNDVLTQSTPRSQGFPRPGSALNVAIFFLSSSAPHHRRPARQNPRSSEWQFGSLSQLP